MYYLQWCAKNSDMFLRQKLGHGRRFSQHFFTLNSRSRRGKSRKLGHLSKKQRQKNVRVFDAIGYNLMFSTFIQYLSWYLKDKMSSSLKLPGLIFLSASSTFSSTQGPSVSHKVSSSVRLCVIIVQFRSTRRNFSTFKKSDLVAVMHGFSSAIA